MGAESKIEPWEASQDHGCLWCVSGRGGKPIAGCCGRVKPHHHTMVQGRDGVCSIPSDDCEPVIREEGR